MAVTALAMTVAFTAMAMAVAMAMVLTATVRGVAKATPLSTFLKRIQ